MPNLRGQTITAGPTIALALTGSDGRTCSLTKAQIQAFYQSTSGNAASRRQQVIAWCTQQISAALGPESVPESLIALEISVADGAVTQLDVWAV